MNFLFFDTETNGKPVKYNASYEEVDNWPRVAQLSWLLADQEGNIINQQNHFVFPEGWEIPTEDFFIQNGMSTERCAELGVPIAGVLDLFMIDKVRADVLVAHNLQFDHRIVWAEFIRQGRRPRSGMHKICTMTSSTKYCNLPGKRGPKWPKLEELHQVLFNKGFEGAHDAMADITATKDCFFELVRLGVITLPSLEPQSQANA